MSGRQRLPSRRRGETIEFSHTGLGFTLCAGFYPDGRIAEIFLSSHNPGSPIRLSGSWAPGSGPNDDIPFGAP